MRFLQCRVFKIHNWYGEHSVESVPGFGIYLYNLIKNAPDPFIIRVLALVLLQLFKIWQVST